MTQQLSTVAFAALIAVSVSVASADARPRGGSHVGHNSSRVYYGGGHHTTSHGGHFAGGVGSSHRGGHYRNARTGNEYGQHK